MDHEMNHSGTKAICNDCADFGSCRNPEDCALSNRKPAMPADIADAGGVRLTLFITGQDQKTILSIAKQRTTVGASQICMDLTMEEAAVLYGHLKNIKRYFRDPRKEMLRHIWSAREEDPF